MRLALVGSGVWAVNLWERDLVRRYGDAAELVGLCDINPGRLAFAKRHIGVECPTFVDYVSLLQETKPEKVIVTTVYLMGSR
jgi:predicted dehydrogenase